MLVMIMIPISKLFDSTLLTPDKNFEEISTFVKKSIENNVRAIAVPWFYIPKAIEMLSDTDIGIIVGIDFPLGYSPLEMKIKEIKYYIKQVRITDFDVMINLCAV